MTKAQEYQRSEDQYLDIVDYITNHPNTEITIGSYLAWPHRNRDIDWGASSGELIARRVGSRLEHLASAVLLPQRPDKAAPSRNTVWLQELLRAGGAFYRVKRGTYILDTAAAWRRTVAGVVLNDNRWAHHPPARVREAMPVRSARTEPARKPIGRDERRFMIDNDADPIVAREVATPTAPLAPTYMVEAAGAMIGDQIVLRRTDTDGTQVLLLAQVSSVIQAVTT